MSQQKAKIWWERSCGPNNAGKAPQEKVGVPKSKKEKLGKKDFSPSFNFTKKS